MFHNLRRLCFQFDIIYSHSSSLPLNPNFCFQLAETSRFPRHRCFLAARSDLTSSNWGGRWSAMLESTNASSEGRAREDKDVLWVSVPLLWQFPVNVKHLRLWNFMQVMIVWCKAVWCQAGFIWIKCVRKTDCAQSSRPPTCRFCSINLVKAQRR